MNKLRVYWFPQVPCKPFIVPVENLREAKLLIKTLADYDEFQFKNKIKPDYCNAGGLEEFDPNDDEESDPFDPNDDTEGPFGSWCEWMDFETGKSIRDIMLEERKS